MEYGTKIIIKHQENLGLRKHILSCGDLTEKYGNIILLEDDLFVSPYFYNYSLEMLKFFRDNEKVAGISLYNQNFNETANLPFAPFKEQYDNYFMKLPSSWGQLWTTNQWQAFKTWYDINKDKDLSVDKDLPPNVRRWPSSSWKKYFIKYMIETDKYFVYPFESYSTNFGDVGQHFWKQKNDFQSVICKNNKNVFNLSNIEDTFSVYDQYCENEKISNLLDDDVIYGNLTVDLYNHKDYCERFLLTTKKLDHEIIDSFALSLKPYEDNILFKVKGKGIFLYDTHKKNINKSKSRNNVNNLLYSYFYAGMDFRKAFQILFNFNTLIEVKEYIKKKYRKLR